MTVKQEKKQKKESVLKKLKPAEENKTVKPEEMSSDGLSFTTKEASSNLYNPLLQMFAQNSSSDYSQQLAMATSLAQVMVSPINLTNLPPSILLQLQQQQQQQQSNSDQDILTDMKEDTTCLQQLDNSRLNDKAEEEKKEATEENVNNEITSKNKKGMSLDEKRQKRLWRNRLAAKECRKKKKMYVLEIEEKVQMLESENERLHKTIKELTAKLEEPQQQQSAENYRLMKEVEELNAKLGMNA